MDQHLSSRTILMRILRQGWRYRWLVATTLASTAVMGSLMAYSVVVLDQVFTLFSLVQAGGGHHLAQTLEDGARHDAIARMKHLALLLMSLTPVIAAAAYTSWYAGQLLANRCMKDLRNRFLAHLIQLEINFHASLARGDLIARMTSDLASLLALQRNLYGKLMQRPFEAACFIAGMFIVNWQFAAIVFLVMMPISLVIARILGKTRKRSQKARETLAANLVAFEQITAGVRVIKAMGSSEREVQRYAVINDSLHHNNMRVARARAQSEFFSQGAVFLLTAVALFIGALLFERDLIRPSVLVAELVALGRLTTCLREIQRVWGDCQECFPAAERIYAILDRPNGIPDRPGAKPCPVPQEAIRLEQVSFRYAADSGDVLRGVTMEIPVGKTVALVGQSGGGKSTILDLIPRFHDVTGGRISIDGIDIRDLTQASLVGHCAIVQQDSFLFNDTIYANILYGRPEATREQVEEAARRAHVHDTILSLEGGLGYQTLVGDRGGRLSGGQRQRIAIARALLRDAPVLLLDEPTSALDAESERHVQEALTELMRGRTTVVVAHRLATIQHADLIYVLAGSNDPEGNDDPRRGTIIEAGNHRELIARGGEYARLVTLQQLRD